MVVALCGVVVYIFIRSCRISSTEDDHGDTENGGGEEHPCLWFLPVQHIFDTALGAVLPKCQWGTSDDAPTSCQTQKRGGVFRADILAHLPHHRLVTAHFHILGGQDKGEPDQRIKPMDTQCKKGESLNNMVQPSNMLLLVEQDIPLFPFGQG